MMNWHKARCDVKSVKIFTLIIVLLCLVYSRSGFGEASSSEVTQAGHNETVVSWRELYLQLGRETYQDNCAYCHDEGIEGAPAIGDQASWSNRSPLWSAILIVHAQNGYLGMPAKGGCAELTDHEVKAAGEYMLSETFPELPRD